jgi:hypothetical protein
MSSVSVLRPGGLDTRRGAFEKAFLWGLRGLLPPARDNQRAADFLQARIGPSHPFVQWTVVRPDTLLEGDVSAYTVREGLVNGVFAPGHTNMANVAHFMCELATSAKTWAAWRGKAPVVVDAPTDRAVDRGGGARPVGPRRALTGAGAFASNSVLKGLLEYPAQAGSAPAPGRRRRWHHRSSGCT